jgi:sigma-B regulation protein RsbU (phosphoserine phosphatase)
MTTKTTAMETPMTEAAAPASRKPRTLAALPLRAHRNQAVSKIAAERSYTHVDVPVLDLFGALAKKESANAVGVVDDALTCRGIVVKKEFFALLSRPYARDVMKNRFVGEVMTEAASFHCDANIFTVAEQLAERVKRPDVEYFTLTDDDGAFRGVFSTQDVLMYLSEITQNDIDLARKIQQRLVKESDCVAGRTFEIATVSESAKGVGGDFYHIKKYDDDGWFVCMCDVAGKGIAASMITAVMWGMMTVYDFRRGIKPIIAMLNNYLIRSFDSEKFVTGVFLDYNERTGVVTVSDMGHSHLGLLRGGRFLRLSKKGRNIPIGVTLDLEPAATMFQTEKNDLLFILTDGILDQENAAGRKYTYQSIASLLRGHAGEPVEVIRNRLYADFKEFQGSHHLVDDATLAVMKFVKQDVVVP